MKKNRKLISLISAAAILTSALPMTGMAITSDIEKDIAKPIKTVFDESSYNYMINNISTLDTNHNNKIDIDDYISIRNGINALYKDGNFNNENNVASYEAYNKRNLDVDGDWKIDVNDYCCMLSYLQKDFEFKINKDNDMAEITGYKDTNARSIVVPTEVYQEGRIYPVMQINDWAFSKVENLEEVTIKDYIQPEWINKYNKPIGPNAIGDPITACTYVKIGNNAFNGCSKLKTINLPYHVDFSTNAFAGTGLANHFVTNGKIKYFKSNNQKIVACGYSAWEYHFGILKLMDGTTSISSNAFCDDFITGADLPETVKFIAEGAFSNNENFTSVKYNNTPITSLRKGDKNIVTRYLSAFNSTPLVANSINYEADQIISTIKENIHYTGNEPLTNEQQKAAVNELGKYLYTHTYYRSFGHKSLFVTDRYNTEDQDRGSICSAGAAFLLDSTECEGFSFAASIILDKLGIKNYSIGGHEHALNAVYLDDTWHTIDFSGDGEREFEPSFDCGNPTNGVPKTDEEIAAEFEEKLKDKEFPFEIIKSYYYGLAGRDQFKMFADSKNNQLKNTEIKFSAPNDDSILTISCNITNIADPQYKVIRDDIQKGIIALNQAAPSDNNWIMDEDVKHCYDQYGVIKKNQWVKDDLDGLCYVDANGDVTYDLIIFDNVVYKNGYAAPSGINDVDGNLFYVNEDGSLAVNTWVNDGDDIYCTNGCGNVIKDQWAYTSYENAYYLGSDGKPESSYAIVNGKVRSNGNVVTSDLIYLSNGTYAADENGYLVKSRWFAPNGDEKYYFDANGKRFEGYKLAKGIDEETKKEVEDMVYFNNAPLKDRLINDTFVVNGKSLIEKDGWFVCGGNYFLTDKNGYIQKGQWVDFGNEKHYLHKDGHWEEKFHLVNGKVYYGKDLYENEAEGKNSEFTLDYITYLVAPDGTFLGEKPQTSNEAPEAQN